jgi:hypothetical protein
VLGKCVSWWQGSVEGHFLVERVEQGCFGGALGK